MLEVRCSNTSSANPSPPTLSSCPTATTGSDQLKVPSIATSNGLFLEDLPGKLEILASSSVFCSADALAYVLWLSEQKSGIFVCAEAPFSSNALGI